MRLVPKTILLVIIVVILYYHVTVMNSPILLTHIVKFSNVIGGDFHCSINLSRQRFTIFSRQSMSLDFRMIERHFLSGMVLCSVGQHHASRLFVVFNHLGMILSYFD